MLDVNSVAIGILSGVGVFVGGKLIWKGLGNRNGKNPLNNTDFKRELNGVQTRFEEHKKTVVYKETCAANLKGVDDKLISMDKKLDRILDK